MPPHNAAFNLANAPATAAGDAMDSILNQAYLDSNIITRMMVTKIAEVAYIEGPTDGTQVGMTTASKVAFHGATPTDQCAALTAQLTTITPADAEGTPDYAIAAVTNTSPYGLASAQEFITLLYVVKNLQVRLAEVEAMLEEKGVCAAN